MSNSRRGICFVISAPSGSGKTTLIKRVMRQLGDIRFITSCTTRPPRAQEVDGQDYHFVSEKKFRAMVDRNAFVEWAEVHGNLYGTPKPDFEQNLADGNDLFLEIDVQGAHQVKKLYPDTVTLFVIPSTPDVLRKRLQQRGDDDEASIARRLKTATDEVKAMGDYDYLVVNDDLECAVSDFVAIIVAQRQRLTYKLDLINVWKTSFERTLWQE